LESYASGEKPSNIQSDPTLRQKLLDLHPASDLARDAVPGDPTDAYDPITFLVEELNHLTSNFSKHSSPAFSGWTFELIRKFSLASPEISLEVAKLINHLINGRGGNEQLWLASRLIPIAKPDGKIRPIAINDCWIRLIGKYIHQKVSAAANNYFKPLQFGDGVPCGADIIIHAAKTAVEHIISDPTSTQAVCQLDVSNAFNTIGRKSFLDPVQKHFPSMYKYVKWCYSGPTPLYDSTGTFICNSSTGVRQGDPLGPLLFALGIHDILKDIAAHPDLTQVTNLAYLDDLTIIGDINLFPKVVNMLKEKFEIIGLKINPEKSQIFSNDLGKASLSDPRRYLKDIDISTSYIKVLGCPIGLDAQVTLKANEIINKFMKILPLVLQLKPQSAYAILNHCINTKPIFLLRMIEPHLIKESITKFDNLIDISLNVICSNFQNSRESITTIEDIERFENLKDYSKLVRRLPRGKGGLGIRSGLDSSEMAWLASWTFSMKWLHSQLPLFLPYYQIKEISPRQLQIINKVTSIPDQLLLPLPIDPNFEQLNHYLELPSRAPSQKDLVSLVVDKMNYDLIFALLGSKNEYRAKEAWFRSQHGKTASYWIDSIQTSNPALRLKDSTFLINIKFRLLFQMIPISFGTHTVCFCRCCFRSNLEVGLDDYHFICCQAFGGPETHQIIRHNQTKAEVKNVFKFVFPEPIYTIQEEQWIHHPARKPGQSVLRSDLSRVPNDPSLPTIYYDFMHTNGATSSKIIKKKTNKKFLKGAQIAEQGKVAKYEAHYENELVKYVIMLIIEAGGALGKGFKDEVNSWFAIPGINKIKLGNLVNWMFRRISFHQANFNEKMYIEAFKSIKRYETQHPTEFPPALLVPNIDEAIYPRFSQVIAIDENDDEDEVPVEIPVEVPVEVPAEVPAEVPVEVPVHQTFQMIED
jgi:hypothetical protein